MPVDENNEGARAESDAEAQGATETSQPPPLEAENDPVRIGTKDDIRLGGGIKRDPRKTLRDGSR